VNEIVSRMINTQLLLFLYMLCGVIVAKLKIIRNDNRQVLVRLLMDVAMPMMVLAAFNKKTTAEDGTAHVDSTKYYVDVEINFHGTDYDKYTVNVYKSE